MSMIRSVVQAAVAVAAMLIAYPAVAQVTNDPFPDPIPASEGVIVVGLEEFAALPDVDGAPARPMVLIDEPGSGRLFEVTQEGKIVWQFTSPFYADMGRYGLTNLVYKAKRYGADDPALVGKDLSPRKYDWLLHRTFDDMGEPVA